MTQFIRSMMITPVVMMTVIQQLLLSSTIDANLLSRKNGHRHLSSSFLHGHQVNYLTTIASKAAFALTDDRRLQQQQQRRTLQDEEEEGFDGGGTMEEEMAWQSCFNATNELLGGSERLSQASQTFAESMESSFEDMTDMSLGFPSSAVEEFQTICVEEGGYWTIVEAELFACEMMGQEEYVRVYGMGDCWANTTDCYSVDPVIMLEDIWEEMGMTCTVASPDDEDGTPENGTTEAEEGEGLDGGDPEGGDYSDLSDDDLACIQETETMIERFPGLETAAEDFAGTMEVNVSEAGTTMQIGFPDDAVEKLRAVCDGAGGQLSIVERQDFACDMMGVQINLMVTNMGNCLADTDTCMNMNLMHLWTDVWQTMGMECTEVDEGGDGGDEGNESGNSTVPPEEGDEDGGEGMDDEDENEPIPEDEVDEDGTAGGGGGTDNSMEAAEVDALGLTESDVACMHDTATFLSNSSAVSSATQSYIKSAEANDPTKFGFPASSVSALEQVCDQQGGLWSAVDSDDVICNINGRNRRINVYNFGNCLAMTDECATMDPLVLVKGFFFEIMHFQCWALSDAPPGGDGTGFYSPNNKPQGSSTSTSAAYGGNGLPSGTVAAIVLCLVVVIGFFAWFRIRRGRGQERISRRAYEMTDVSDLRFDTLT